MYSNNFFITRPSKISQVFSKLLQQLKPFKYTGRDELELKKLKEKNARAIDYITTTKKLTKQLFFFDNNMSYQFSNFVTQGKKKMKKRIKKNTGYINLYKTPTKNFTLLSPKIITTYVCALLNKNSNFKNDLTMCNPFLNPSIPVIINYILSPLKKKLLGVKIICSGR
mgnify:FL=1